MEFLTQQPSVLPPKQYTYQGRIIIHLTSHESSAVSSGGGLTSVLSRGSDGRRGSVGDRRGSFGASNGGNDDHNGSSGLRRILSRGDGNETTSTGAGMGRRSSEIPGGRRGSVGSDCQQTGKWEAKGNIGLTQTHIIIRLDHPLTPYTSESDGRSSSGAGIGDKIKGLFYRHGNKDTTDDDRVATNTALNANAGQATFGQPTIGSTGHKDASYPAHINGQNVTYISIPLTAVSPTSDVKQYQDKRSGRGSVEVVSVPVRGHFGSMVAPMLGELGREHDQSWGRSGKVKFEFASNSLSGKAEAEVLHHVILSSVNGVNGSGGR